MRSLNRFPRWLALLSLLLLPFNAPSAPAPAWSPPDPLKLKDQEIRLLRQQLGRAKTDLGREKLARIVDETQLQVAALRGFGIHEVVRSAPLTGKVVAGLVEDSFRRQYPGRALEFYVWFNEILGALPEGTDLKGLLSELMGEQAAGIYDPLSQTLYVRQDISLEAPLGRMILAHEICHALQDQNHSLMEMGVEEADDADRSLAILALAEGDATLLMSEHLAKFGNPMSILSQLPEMMSMDQEKFNRAPQIIQQTVLFPYLQGMKFFSALDGRTRTPARVVGAGEGAWRDQVFKDPPTTTEQILHPQKYLARELPAKIAPLRDDKASTSAANVLGEFGIASTFEPLLGKARATQAAAGWNGDRLLIADHDRAGERHLHWLSRWDSPKDADEFAAALEDALKSRYSGKLAWHGEKTARQGQAPTATLELRRPAADTVELKGIFKLEEEKSKNTAQAASSRRR